MRFCTCFLLNKRFKKTLVLQNVDTKRKKLCRKFSWLDQKKIFLYNNFGVGSKQKKISWEICFQRILKTKIRVHFLKAFIDLKKFCKLIK